MITMITLPSIIITSVLYRSPEPQVARKLWRRKTIQSNYSITETPDHDNEEKELINQLVENLVVEEEEMEQSPSSNKESDECEYLASLMLLLLLLVTAHS